MRIVVLTGGIGGARFLLGVRAYAREVGAEVTAVVNVGDDLRLHGLRVCPDLDSVMYTLGGGADPERGWGRTGESWTVKDELAAYGAEPSWFGLGDKDLATHLVRTQMLDAGYPLHEVTEALATRWQPGIRLLPATNDRLETHAIVSARSELASPAVTNDAHGVEFGGTQRAIHFQEWWVRHRAQLPTHRFVFVGADAAKPAPGVTEAIAEADVVLIAPSNPVVSITPILAVAGLRDAVANGPAPVVGVSPIIGGAPVRGMADRCLAVVGVECSAAGVGQLYGARSAGGLLDGWLVAEEDAQTLVPQVSVRAAPLRMSDEAATVAMVRAAVGMA
ncbi:MULTISPECIES: 2-phospho-L-lactate transferase [Micromonospora]|uniref:2-phospho-L-lactate transferase n=1 Tax=Micromonospora maris TaxID=1003110 RepID=A0A9X0LFM1_9ACTN|nr:MULTISPECIES: 2-phospho-L-lactate transferase [Micromonospora]AEB43011.1 LPPG:FO 2-phospho-L-lactate transferase [Micromonospora maris AB-18-032]KUJ48393.1 2-phospho-L-lactate transferase [Micromonospora maris]RUL93309.1 2-phospho-L-lactate transferase [Verrucosispora sp. FIM060022]